MSKEKMVKLKKILPQEGNVTVSGKPQVSKHCTCMVVNHAYIQLKSK